MSSAIQPISASLPPASPRTGPLRSGNPRGNPNLAPRCGAKTRADLACRAPAMSNGRCRMHGGCSTGPRTEAGLARLAAARTTHGRFTAETRAERRHIQVWTGRVRVLAGAARYRRWLPEALRQRLLAARVPELDSPPQPRCGGISRVMDRTPCTVARDGRGRFVAAPVRGPRGRAAERLAGRAEAAALAPWKVAIAAARLMARAERDAECGHHLLQRGDGGSRGGAVPEGMAGSGPAMTGGVGAELPVVTRDLERVSEAPSACVSRDCGQEPMQRGGGVIGNAMVAPEMAGTGPAVTEGVSAAALAMTEASERVNEMPPARVSRDRGQDPVQRGAGRARTVRRGMAGSSPAMTERVGKPRGAGAARGTGDVGEPRAVDQLALPPVGLRALLLGGTSQDESPFWVTVEGGLGAVWAAMASGQDVDTAISAQSHYTRQ